MNGQRFESIAGPPAAASPLLLILGSKCTPGEARVSTAGVAEVASYTPRELAFRIRAGDAAAERELYLNYARALRYLVQRRCGDEHLAHDLVQECFRIALTHLRAGKLENPDTLAGFLRGIALNLVSTQQRSGWRERSTDTDADLPGIEDVETPGPLEVVTREQLRMLVRRLIAEMPVQRDRELLWRYYVLDQDKQLLCDALQLSPTHFDRVLHRARNRFRELASEHGLNTTTDVP